MNKNDKFQVEEFEVNAQAVTDEKLEGVAGGNSEEGEPYIYSCPVCGEVFSSMLRHVAMDYLNIHIEHTHPGYYSPTNQFS